MLLAKDHLPFRAVQCPPYPDPTLQGTPQIIGELARVPTLHLPKDGDRPQSWRSLEQRHDLALEVRFQRVGPAPAARLAFAGGQPGIGIEPCAGAGAETGLGRGGLSAVRRSELHVQLRLLVCDVSAGHREVSSWRLSTSPFRHASRSCRRSEKTALTPGASLRLGYARPPAAPGATHPD